MGHAHQHGTATPLGQARPDRLTSHLLSVLCPPGAHHHLLRCSWPLPLAITQSELHMLIPSPHKPIAHPTEQNHLPWSTDRVLTDDPTG